MHKTCQRDCTLFKRLLKNVPKTLHVVILIHTVRYSYWELGLFLASTVVNAPGNMYTYLYNANYYDEQEAAAMRLYSVYGCLTADTITLLYRLQY